MMVAPAVHGAEGDRLPEATWDEGGAAAALAEQVERFAEEFSAVVAELWALRKRESWSNPERAMASRLRDSFDSMLRSLGSFGFFVLDQAGRITHATGQSEKLFGLPVAALTGKPLSSFVQVSGDRCIDMELQDLLAGMAGRVDRLPVQARSGPHAQLILHALRGDHPSPEAMYCLLRPADPSEIERPVQHMLLADVFAGSNDAWMVVDGMRRILAVNTGFTAVTGYEPFEVIGKTPKVIGSGRHDAGYYARLSEALDTTGEWQGEICNRRRNGELYEEWLHISAYRDGAGRTCGYVALFYDLVFARKAYERIDYLVHTDALTKLPNRALFLDRLAQAVKRGREAGRPFGILAFDIDHFSEINDTLGHDAGDRVLSVVAASLDRLADERMMVARLGGDEFVVLAEDGEVGSLEGLAAQLRGLLELPVLQEGRDIHVTLSGGIAYFPAHGEDASALLRNAEIAVDMARERGGDTTQIYQDEFSRRRLERFSLASAMRHALERRQFSLVYQPQVDSVTRAVTGVEALLRWRLPEQGEVSPAQFIPIAEETGLIVQIGAWVLEQACRQQAEWVRQGLRPIRMAVNIAGRQLREPGFCSMVAAIVERCGIAPRLLEIEVTESELMGEVDQAARVLVQLAAMGVGIAVDDFGTGHSSLARLHALSVDRLKVDRSFVLAMGEGGKGAAIPRAILALAASLGLASVAEGVETEAQASLLQEWGCGEMQGYLFSRPVPAAQIAALLR